MADKRMFSLSVIDSDDFTSMPQTSQLLYFHLAMRADDDGFVNKPRQIMSFIRAADDDMKVLIAKQYVIPFDNGIIVIRHWRLHNCIRKDTYHPSKYTSEKAQLGLLDDGSYTVNDTLLLPRDEPVTDPLRNRTVDKISIDKDRLGKDSIGEVRDDAPAGDPLIMFAADNLVGMNADLAEELVSYRGQMTDDMIRWAINETLSNGSRAFSYTRRILNRIVECGHKTLAEVKAAEEARRKEKEAAKQAPAPAQNYGKPKKPMDSRDVKDEEFSDCFADIMNRPRSRRDE